MRTRSVSTPPVVACVTAAFGLCCVTSLSQVARQYTTQDYAQAEKFMPYKANPLAYKGDIRAQWLDDGRFWYRDVDSSGASYVLVDVGKGMRTSAFDQARLAAALSAASNGAMKDDARHLKISDISLNDNDSLLAFHYSGVFYRCGLAPNDYHCKLLVPGAKAQGQRSDVDPPPLNVSPNRRLGTFVRDWNLWVLDLTTGTETQLTTDGVKDYGYATDNAGWKQTNAAVLLWSPDSTKIATFQQDQRKTGEMYLVPVTNTHPELKAWKYPMVGDANVTMIERVIIDVNSRKTVLLKMAPDQHRSTVCDDVACNGDTWDDVEWSQDGSHLAFVSTSRDHKQEWMRVADVSTGEVRDVLGETVRTFYESGDGKVNWHYLPGSNEILWMTIYQFLLGMWFSERDNCGNLYLYNLGTDLPSTRSDRRATANRDRERQPCDDLFHEPVAGVAHTRK